MNADVDLGAEAPIHGGCRCGEIEVTARVRSDEVAHALEALRGDHGFGGGDGRFTWAGRSRFLHLERREPQWDPLVEISVNGRSAAELTEIALRTALFQERNPLADQHLGFMAEMSDPLQPLRDASVSDEIARSLAELLIVDALVGSGRVSRVTEFRLGASVRGMRRLTLAFESWQYYASGRPKARAIEGQVRL